MSARTKCYISMACFAVLPLYVGCGSSSGSGGGASMDAMANALDAQKSAQQHDQSQADAERAAQEAQAAAEQTAAEPERQVAGRDGVAPGGYYTAIVGARRHVLNKVEGLAWQQAVSHFQAEHGRLPKDHAEFMSRIVEPLGIDLGFKEENQEFLYDPNDKTTGQYGTLFVVEKETAAAPQ